MSHPELSWQVVKEGGWASHSKLRAVLNQESGIDLGGTALLFCGTRSGGDLESGVSVGINDD